ncbi:MAG TPA: hypothetical protein VFS40_13575 [Gemmatimonadales bacterium]|nr:hypothetical protein [Gemmatimonadales bacterium]
MSTSYSRREFTEAIAAAAVLPFIGRGLPALGGRPVRRDGPDAARPVADPSALARALTDAVRATYGERLSAADLATVAAAIEANLRRAEQVRRLPLTNGDEPLGIAMLEP